MPRSNPLSRRPLGSLGPNIPLSMRMPVKTPPITYDQENEIEVDFGIAVGIYDAEEIYTVTNFSLGPSDSRDQVSDSDDDEGIQALARDLGETGWPGQNTNRHTDVAGDSEHEHPGDDSEHSEDDDEEEGDEEGDEDDEARLVAQYAGLDDEDMEPTDEFEYDHQGVLDSQMPITILDPVALGLKEINNLAHFSVSSHKPGNGVIELLSDDLDKYWQ